MEVKLLTVEAVFDIPGRGLIVVPGPPVASFASPAEVLVTLRRPDGTVLHATASIEVQFQSPPPREHRYALILKGVGAAEVPIGAEIWLESGARG